MQASSNILSKSPEADSHIFTPTDYFDDEYDVIDDDADAAGASSDVIGADGGRIADIDIDPYARKLYYIDTQRDAIVVVNISSKFQVIGDIINGAGQHGCEGTKPQDVAVDAING